MSDDQDHLRDDPTLPGHHATRHPLDRSDEEAVEDRKRTPILKPLFPDDGGFDLSLGEDM